MLANLAAGATTMARDTLVGGGGGRGRFFCPVRIAVLASFSTNCQTTSPVLKFLRRMRCVFPFPRGRREGEGGE